MHSIPLTQKHKDKLLEMCIALFPEYSVKTKLSSAGNLLFGNGIDKKATLKIHWFEFCLTHLCEKILNPETPSRTLQNKFKEFFWETNLYWDYNTNKKVFTHIPKHPIDYLYEEFKTLK